MSIRLTYLPGAAIVVGGAGGVGEGVTRRLAEAGLPVVFTYRENAARARALAHELKLQSLSVWAHEMDAGSPAAVQETIKFAEDVAGTLRTLVYAAGPRVPFEKFADFEDAVVHDFVKEDAVDQSRVVRYAVRALRASGGGSVTLCSTIAVNRMLEFDGLSAFSKASVGAMARQIAWEEGPHNIRCNVVGISMVTSDTPSVTLTDLYNGTQLDFVSSIVSDIGKKIRLPRKCFPSDAGNLFAYLASEEARFVTGQVINLDGGASL